MSAIGLLSYGFAAAAFFLLAVLLTVSWRGRRQGVYLIAASALTAAWAVLLAVQAASGRMPLLIVYLVEMLRNAGWLFALSSVAAMAGPRRLIGVTRIVCFLTIAAVVILPFVPGAGAAADNPTLLLSRAGLLTSLVGMVLLEQIYRNANSSARGSIKYLAIGIGGLFAYDLFLYSQAELLKGITEEAWTARGVLNALAVPMVAIAVRRYPQWSLDVFVSRQVVFHTTTLIGVGAYLLLMATGGYYVREIGGAWGRVGQIIFFGGALVVLTFLVGSTTLRRHARVFISKHFYRNKYDYRIEWLRFIGTLSSEQEDDVRRTAIRAVAEIFASPGAVLLTVDDAGQRFVPAAAWPMRLDGIAGLQDVPADEDLPRFLARTQWIIDLPELRRTPDTYGNVMLPDWIAAIDHLRIISPLLKLDRLVGFVLLYEPPAPFELTYEDRDLLKTVGRHVATHIAQHEADRKLAESAQFEAYNRLTAFLMHDLKNSVAQLKLIVTNASRHKHNPEFIEDAIGTIANAVDRMTRLIEQLRGDPSSMRDAQVPLEELARSAARRCADRLPVPTVTCSVAATVRADPERLNAIIEHLIRNAQDASAQSDTITVEIVLVHDSVMLTVADTGSGMAPEFVRERLFRPFDSTKGSKGMGIGAYQVREYVRMIGGRVEVQSNPGNGTRFSITLPLIQQRAPERAQKAVLSR